MSSKKALKKSQKLAFQKHKANSRVNNFLPKNTKFSVKSVKKLNK